MEETMKNNRKKVGYGLLSLALALALPLNALADEVKEEPASDQGQQTDTLIKDEEIKTEDTSANNQAPAPQVEAPQVARPTNPAPQVLAPSQNLEANTNYISQQGKERKDAVEVTPYDVEFKEEKDGAKNVTYLSYSFDIKGDDLPKEYTISVFALKNGEVKNLSIDNIISDDNILTTSEEIEKVSEKIENDDIKGYQIKTEITSTGSVKATVKIEEDEDPGDYSIYYQVSREGKATLGKFDANLGKSGEYSFYMDREEVKKDYEKSTEEKEKPFENLPFTKYLLNDTDEEKKLEAYLDLGLEDKASYKLEVTYIDPENEEVKTEEITDLEGYLLPANTLAKLEVKEKKEDLIDESEILEDKVEVAKENEEASSEKTEQAKNTKSPDELVKEERENLEKANPDLDSESLDVKALAYTIEKQNDRLKDLISDSDKAKVDPTSLTEEEISDDARSKALKLVEEKKKSILELEPDIDEENLDIRSISQALRAQTKKIQDLIQQAFLNYELDSLAELEKENPDKAKEEYKKIAELIKEAKETNKKAEVKLVELDEIILIENTTDPLMKRVNGAKPVLNLGMLTPLTKIENLTKDSPKESERDFSTNLEKKLDAAVKKVETVTITEKDDKKAEEKTNKDDKDKSQEKSKEETKEINTPIFVRYLLSSNKENKSK